MQTRLCPQCGKVPITDFHAVCETCKRVLLEEQATRKENHERILADIKRRDKEMHYD